MLYLISSFAPLCQRSTAVILLTAVSEKIEVLPSNQRQQQTFSNKIFKIFKIICCFSQLPTVSSASLSNAYTNEVTDTPLRHSVHRSFISLNLLNISSACYLVFIYTTIIHIRKTEKFVAVLSHFRIYMFNNLEKQCPMQSYYSFSLSYMK